MFKSDLELILQNSKDFKIEHLKKYLDYDCGFDKEIAMLSDDQAEKVARCLVKVYLYRTLKLMLNAKFKILFRYVRSLNVRIDIKTQSDLERLFDLFPYLVRLNQSSGPGDGDTCLAIAKEN